MIYYNRIFKIVNSRIEKKRKISGRIVGLVGISPQLAGAVR